MDRAYHSLPTTVSHSSTKTASTAEEYDRTGQLSPEELIFRARVAKLMQEMEETDAYVAEVKLKCISARQDIRKTIKECKNLSEIYQEAVDRIDLAVVHKIEEMIRECPD